MRQWLCDPKIMCRQHLLAEHNECHMFLGSLKKQINIDGYINNDLLEPLSLKSRHDALADEIVKRKYNHNSPLIFEETIFSYLSNLQINHKINKDNSLKILISRCNNCYQNYLTSQVKGVIRKMYSITKSFKFEAAHRLFTMANDHPCKNIHGHSYVVKVSIFIEDISKMINPNMVLDFAKLKEFQLQLNEYFDHSLILHEDDPIGELLKDHICKIIRMPFKLDVTAENMAYLFSNSINEICKKHKILEGSIQVEVDETVGNTAAYMRNIGPGE